MRGRRLARSLAGLRHRCLARRTSQALLRAQRPGLRVPSLAALQHRCLARRGEPGPSQGSEGA